MEPNTEISAQRKQNLHGKRSLPPLPLVQERTARLNTDCRKTDDSDEPYYEEVLVDRPIEIQATVHEAKYELPRPSHKFQTDQTIENTSAQSIPDVTQPRSVHDISLNENTSIDTLNDNEESPYCDNCCYLSDMETVERVPTAVAEREKQVEENKYSPENDQTSKFRTVLSNKIIQGVHKAILKTHLFLGYPFKLFFHTIYVILHSTFN